MQPLGVYDKVFKETPGNGVVKQAAALRAVSGVDEDAVSDTRLLLTFKGGEAKGGRKPLDKKRQGIRDVVYKKWAPADAKAVIMANRVRKGVKVCYDGHVYEVSNVKSERARVVIYFQPPSSVSGYATKPTAIVFTA